MGYIGQAPTKVPLTSADILDGSIALADIANNAIDETKLKDALVGDFSDVTVTAADAFLYGDATDSGNTKKDTVQGILDLVSGGGLVHLQSQTASTSASIAFSSTYITSTYNTYVIYASDIMPATDGAIFEVHYSEDNGSSYLTSGYGFVIDGIDHAGNNAGYSGGSASDADLTFEIDSGTMGVQGNIGMHFVLSDPTTANNCSHLAAMSSYRDNSDTLIVSSTVVGHNAATNAVNNIKFEMSSGTISTGYFNLFGVSTG